MRALAEAPRRLGAKAGFTLFLAVELMFFAGLLSAAVALRLGAAPQPWTVPGSLEPGGITGGLLALILLGAAGQVFASRHPSWASGRFHLGLAAGLGLAFLGLMTLDAWQRWNEGFRPSSSVTAGLFYALNGAFAVHLAAATVALAWLERGGQARREGLEGALVLAYWGFLALLWVPFDAVLYFW